MIFLSWTDFFLMPLYLLLAYLLLNGYFKKRHGFNPQLKKHFNRGLTLKLVGCIFVAVIYEFYYKGAYDGRFYFEGGKMLTGYWMDYPSEFFRTLFIDMYEFNNTNLNNLSTSNVEIHANESFVVAKIVALFNIFSFNYFIPCSIFFCIVAFIALWNFFIFLIKEFSLSAKLAAISSIYIPSLLIWDSSIFKDTVSFTALIWLFICSYYTFIKPRKVTTNVFGIIICLYLIVQIKVYIIAAFAPFFILYAFNTYKARIKSQTLRTLSTPFILAGSIGLVILFLQNAEDLLGKYSIDNVLDTATQTYYGIISAGQAGSAYSIDVDFSSPTGLLAAIPQGINVTLFRPYPWEYLRPIILFASAESMVILYFTIYLIFKIGVGKTFKTIAQNPIMQFSLIFSLVFAFMVGISASNFGTLVRYKIPVMPFYILFLVLLYKYNLEVFKPKMMRKVVTRRVVA
jgi:hypothetical protein